MRKEAHQYHKKERKQNNLYPKKADKTLLIINKNEYGQKLEEFMTKNNFT
jgi:hypothetical protein